MPTDQILNIAPDKNDPNFQIIQFKNRKDILLNNLDVKKLNIKTGMTWNNTHEEQIKKILEMEKTRAAAMAYLSKKDMSQKKLAGKLSSNGFLFGEKISTDLKKDGWISDQRVAETIASKGNSKSHSKNKILETLTTEGIKATVAIQAIDVALENISEKERIKKYATEEMKKYTGLPSYKIMRKLAAKLVARGWDEQEIADIFYEMGLELEQE